MFDVNKSLLWLLFGAIAAMCGGTLVRIVALRKAEPELKRKRMGSLKVWWVLTLLMSAAAILGRPGVALLLAIASILGLREYLNLVGRERIGQRGVIAAFATIPLQYLLIGAGMAEEAKIALPAGALILVSTLRLLDGKSEGFIRTTAGTFWGVMLLVYCLSHAALLLTLPSANQPAVGMAGWFLFVVIVTEMDDIAQALVGRVIGRRKITPTISPNKTWEGFGGGVITSVLLSLLLAPWLTTFPPASTVNGFLITVGAGLALVCAAFLGDINMSAIKRDVGVKDGSAILPGMGGMIDRIDSLTFTAPVFYYFVCAVT